MSKVKKNTPPNKQETAHLEETLTEVTDRVAAFAKRFWVPVVVACVAVIAILGLSSIFQWFAKSRQQELAAEIYTAFTAPDDEEKQSEKRAALDELWGQLKGKPQETVFAVQYSTWLWETAKAPERAVQVLDEARARHPEDAVLEFFQSRFASTLKASEGFVTPTPPPPPEPTPIPAPTPLETPPTILEPAGGDG